MDKSIKGKSLNLILLACAFILGTILLNSCGQGNPAGSPQTSAILNTPQSAGPSSAAATPKLLAIVKSSPTSITIQVNPPDPKQKYTLYVSDSFKIDASTSAMVPNASSNSYTLNLAQDKTYMFLLVMETSSADNKPALAYIISKPGKNKNRMNMIRNNAAPVAHPPNAAMQSAPQMLTAPTAQQCGFYFSDYYQPWKLTLISGGYFPVFNYVKSVGPIFEETFWNNALISPIPLPPFPDNACQNISGGWDPWAPVQPCYYDYKFMGQGSYWYVPCGPQPTAIVITPATATIPIGGIQQFTATGTFPDGSVSDITLQAAWAINCTPDNELGIARIDETGLATGRNPGTCEVTATLENVTSPPATLIVGSVTINVSPASATAYLHPTPTNPQFSATDSNNNDVTNTVQWSVNPTGYATIAAGLVTPTKPGEASVTAALLDGAGNVSASGQASLDVMCRDYPDYKQTDYTTTYYDSTKITFDHLGCAVTAMAEISTAASWSVTPDILNSAMFGDIAGSGVSWKYLNSFTNNRAVLDISLSNIADVPFNFSNSFSPSKIDTYVDDCKKAVIVGVAKRATAAGYIDINPHFVVVTGRKGSTYMINDPLGKASTLDYYGNVIYSYIVYTINN